MLPNFLTIHGHFLDRLYGLNKTIEHSEIEKMFITTLTILQVNKFNMDLLPINVREYWRLKLNEI